ncbi:MAG: N-acetylmuramoyl-L-alanine amidase [Clostridia bacterium]|nr:N-acetylmuramoyl-L-alanine amidase [Clostridia bacterium]
MRVKSNKKSDFSRYFGIKEGISLVLCASFILLSAALVGGFSGSTMQNILTENSLNVNSSETNEELTIVVDAGHGGLDCGAVGIGGVLEKELNLDIALMLRDMLVFSGYNVVLTRSDDTMYYDENSSLSKKAQDTRRRIEITKEYENCIFVSVHMNKFVSEKYSGLQVYYSDNVEGGRELAQNIQSFAKELLQKDNDRKIKKANSTIYVLDKAVVPSVLVECGFLSNAAETEGLCDKEYRRDIATMLFMAIDDYISSLSAENSVK